MASQISRCAVLMGLWFFVKNIKSTCFREFERQNSKFSISLQAIFANFLLKISLSLKSEFLLGSPRKHSWTFSVLYSLKIWFIQLIKSILAGGLSRMLIIIWWIIINDFNLWKCIVVKILYVLRCNLVLLLQATERFIFQPFQLHIRQNFGTCQFWFLLVEGS